jgi:hypothetical protein
MMQVQSETEGLYYAVKDLVDQGLSMTALQRLVRDMAQDVREMRVALKSEEDG